MIVTHAPEAVPDTATDVEAKLAAGVIGALLREDYAGLSRHVRSGPGGPVLAIPGLTRPGGPVLPLRADGFLGDFAVVRDTALTLADIECVLGAAAAADAAGVAAFGVECRQALETLRLRVRHLPATLPPGPWLGASGTACYDAVAAARPHPAYPTAACRLGFTEEDSLRYAPEFWPEFELNWVAVPIAALLADTGDGLVIEELAGPEPVPAYFRRYLDLVFGIAVRLFVRYGIALESHQQNAAVIVPAEPPAAAGGPGPGLRLLVKDFDGALINHSRLAAALGGAAPEPGGFGDPRMLTASDDALADVFITITVHLCAGALAFGLAERGYAPLPALLTTVREALAAALDQQAGEPAAQLLRARVLEAGRLPVKAMLTAGTLTGKDRTGASDINKFYGPPGPNYLRDAR